MEITVKNVDGHLSAAATKAAGEALANVKAKGDAYWDMAKKKGESLWAETQSAGRQSWGWTKGFVRRNPGQAVGYAALLGAVIAILLYPKNKE
ncbi:MAG: hypothetical protein IPP68_05030 [Elusimicrobia bacterium]|nr:hypothetical protein [Elusimicrobiota bacterium]